jgi:hypothetical protein
MAGPDWLERLCNQYQSYRLLIARVAGTVWRLCNYVDEIANGVATASVVPPWEANDFHCPAVVWNLHTNRLAIARSAPNPRQTLAFLRSARLISAR